MAITFPVSRVTRARTPLVSAADDEAMLLHGKRVEALGASVARFVPAYGHGLLGAVHQAYADHYPLVLSPDAIWLAIAQGFAMHVCANAERLRGKFVRHEGQSTIRIYRNDFVKGSRENPWPEVFSAFSDAVAQRIGKQRDLVVCDFSTTGACERAASEIVLLDAMKQYFRYELVTMCGIPEITLEGTVDDWRAIRRRARALEEYELGWWTEGLAPVLEQLVATAEGRVDVRFWETLFKPEGGSGGPYVQGWINVLFPYLKAGRGEELNRNEMVTQWSKGFGADFGGGSAEHMIPSGLSRVPFEWLYLKGTYPMEFLGGFVGLSQDSGALALRPVIGWAVRDAAPYAALDAAPNAAPPQDRARPKTLAASAVPPVNHLDAVVCLIAGKIVDVGEVPAEDSEELILRIMPLCLEKGAFLTIVPVDLSPENQPLAGTISLGLAGGVNRLAVGVKVSAKSGSKFFFSIDDLQRALSEAQSVPEEVWRALREIAPGALVGDLALYLVSSLRGRAGELVFGSHDMLSSVTAATVTPSSPYAVIDISPEAHAARVQAACELGINGSAARYKIS